MSLARRAVSLRSLIHLSLYHLYTVKRCKLYAGVISREVCAAYLPTYIHIHTFNTCHRPPRGLLGERARLLERWCNERDVTFQRTRGPHVHVSLSLSLFLPREDDERTDPYLAVYDSVLSQKASSSRARARAHSPLLKEGPKVLHRSRVHESDRAGNRGSVNRIRSEESIRTRTWSPHGGGSSS